MRYKEIKEAMVASSSPASVPTYIAGINNILSIVTTSSDTSGVQNFSQTDRVTSITNLGGEPITTTTSGIPSIK